MPAAPAAARAREAQRLGALAELAVVDYLTATGATILGTNVRVGRYEVDIVAREGRVILVVEVRTRSATSWTTGFGSLDPRKRASVRRAAERLWQRRFKKDESVDRIRIDAASVKFENGEATIEYVKAAF